MKFEDFTEEETEEVTEEVTEEETEETEEVTEEETEEVTEEETEEETLQEIIEVGYDVKLENFEKIGIVGIVGFGLLFGAIVALTFSNFFKR